VYKQKVRDISSKKKGAILDGLTKKKNRIIKKKVKFILFD
jgi:hypothetical protein